MVATVCRCGVADDVNEAIREVLRNSPRLDETNAGAGIEVQEQTFRSASMPSLTAPPNTASAQECHCSQQTRFHAEGCQDKQLSFDRRPSVEQVTVLLTCQNERRGEIAQLRSQAFAPDNGS